MLSFLRKILLVALCLSCCLCLAACDKEVTENDFSLTFLDLFGAECCVLQCGQVSAVFDAAEENDFSDIAMKLDEKGIDTLDFLFLSHPHSDHTGSALKLIKHYKPKEIILSPVFESIETIEDIQAAANPAGSAIRFASAGDSFPLGDAYVHVLAPASAVYRDLNNYSLVLKLDYGENSFLFTGDAGTASELEMLHNNFDLQADFLKVAHHGSDTSTRPEFLEAVSPSVALISSDADDLSHPTFNTLSKLELVGAQIYRTDTHGEITVTSDGHSLTISTEK